MTLGLLNYPVAMRSVHSNFQGVSFRRTEGFPMVKSCEPQKQVELFPGDPSSSHGEFLLLILILDKTAIQDPLIVEIQPAIHALPDGMTGFRMLPCMPAALGWHIPFHQLSHSPKPEVKKKDSPGSQVRMDVFESLDLGVLCSQHRKRVGRDQDGLEEPVIAK